MISTRSIHGAEPSDTTKSLVSTDRCRAPIPAGNVRQPAPPHGKRRYFLRGLTLIELLVVVAIAVALSAIAVPTYQGYMDDVRLSNVVGDIALISIQLERYRSDHRGALPDTLAQTPASHLVDPWGNPYRYFNIETAGPGLGKMRKDKNLVPLNTDFDLYSMGKDGKSKAPLTAKDSRDDIVRANNGAYVGPASKY